MKNDIEAIYLRAVEGLAPMERLDLYDLVDTLRAEYLDGCVHLLYIYMVNGGSLNTVIDMVEGAKK